MPESGDGFPLPAFAGTSFAGMTASVKVTCLAEMMSFPRKRESISVSEPRNLSSSKARPGRSSGWAASRKASRRSARSLQSPVRSPETAPDKSSEDEVRVTVHRDRYRASTKSGRGRAKARLAGLEPGTADAVPGTAPGIGPCAPGTAGGHSGTIGRAGACRMPGRAETIDLPGVHAPADGCAAHCRMLS